MSFSYLFRCFILVHTIRTPPPNTRRKSASLFSPGRIIYSIFMLAARKPPTYTGLIILPSRIMWGQNGGKKLSHKELWTVNKRGTGLPLIFLVSPLKCGATVRHGTSNGPRLVGSIQIRVICTHLFSVLVICSFRSFNRNLLCTRARSRVTGKGKGTHAHTHLHLDIKLRVVYKGSPRVTRSISVYPRMYDAPDTLRHQYSTQFSMLSRSCLSDIAYVAEPGMISG